RAQSAGLDGHRARDPDLPVRAREDAVSPRPLLRRDRLRRSEGRAHHARALLAAAGREAGAARGSGAGEGRRMSRRRRTVRAAALIGASLALTSCETMMRVTEVAGPTALAIGNAILSAAAANYSGEYSTQVQALVSSFTASSQVALNSFLNQRKQQR